MNPLHHLTSIYQNNLIPVNPFALAPQATVYEYGQGKQKNMVLAVKPPHIGQYGYGIPLVSIYNDGQDVFTLSSKGTKQHKLTPVYKDSAPGHVGQTQLYTAVPTFRSNSLHRI